MEISSHAAPTSPKSPTVCAWPTWTTGTGSTEPAYPSNLTNSHATQPRPNRFWLADPSRALEYRVEASNSVRYLGIFFDHSLNNAITLQNAAIRHITSAFCTTPVDPST